MYANKKIITRYKENIVNRSGYILLQTSQISVLTYYVTTQYVYFTKILKGHSQ